MIQDSLFSDITVTAPTPAQKRESVQHRKARLAYLATAPVWKAAVYRFAVESFLPHHSEFIFEQLTILYSEAEKTQRLPATVNKKAFAGLRMRLIREGLIEAIPGVTENRTQGSPSQKYRRV